MSFPLPDTPHLEVLQEILDERASWLERDSAVKFRDAADALADFRAVSCDFSGDVVRIGLADEVDDDQRVSIEKHLRAFMPWRKGPFNVFGIDIDAEWRSFRKWNRLKAYLPNLQGQDILDVGCNNGYYMFRMAHQGPRSVLGIDPTVQFAYTFRALNAMAGMDNLRFELLGVEHVHLFPECFDTIFLMGILYHHPSPLEMLKQVMAALRPGGALILETQGIPGEQPVALFPAKRYAKVPGTYFVPTVSCLENLMRRAGCGQVEIIDAHAMSSQEQRATEWMIYESYADYVQKEDASLTVEGYPAPLRIYARAVK